MAIRTRQLLERREGGSQGAGRPGGHHVYCWKCGGFRVHTLTMEGDYRLVAECRSCGEETPHIRMGEGGNRVWVPIAVAAALADVVEEVRDAVDRGTIEEIGAFADGEDDHAGEGGAESGDGRDAEPREMPPGPARPRVKQTGPPEGSVAADEPAAPPLLASGTVVIDGDLGISAGPSATSRLERRIRAAVPRGRHVSRRAWKAIAAAASAPFALMGALTALAWRGVYVWPIYYAIQPYYRPWMNDWPFVSLSVAVPAAVSFAYLLRFRRARAAAPEASSQGDRKPGVPHSTGDQGGDQGGFDRPDWIDQG